MSQPLINSAPASRGLCCGLESSVPCCPAIDVCHQEGSCDPLVGTCDNPTRPDGSSCDSGLTNAVPMTCSSGACGTCTPPGICTCTLDSQCPTGETCTGGVCSSGEPPVRAVRGCTSTAGTFLPAVKAECINECALRCGDDGQRIFGCLVGQDFTVDRWFSDCNGFSPRCLDSCLQTIDCISKTGEGACTPP